MNSILVIRRKSLTTPFLRIGQSIRAAHDQNPKNSIRKQIKTYLVDSIYTHGGDDAKRIVVVRDEKTADPSEWFICNCRSEFGTPVLYNFRKVGCENNIRHFVKQRQFSNFDRENVRYTQSRKLETVRSSRTVIV